MRQKSHSMCDLYSITTNQAAIAALFRVVNNLPPVPGQHRRIGEAYGSIDSRV